MGAVLLSLGFLILGIVLDELLRYAKKRYSARNPLDIEWFFVKAPARLATRDSLDSFECPKDVSPFDYISVRKDGVWCKRVNLHMNIRNKCEGTGTIEINNFEFSVRDSEPYDGAVIFFVPAGANDTLGFIVNLDNENPVADQCKIENHMPLDDSIITDWFGSGASITLNPEGTCHVELIAQVEMKCRTFTMNINYSIAGKPKKLQNVFSKPITVTPFGSNVFKQSLVSLPGKHTFIEKDASGKF